MAVVSFSLRTKIALSMALVAALIVAAIVGLNFRIRSVQLLQEFQAFVQSAAGTTAGARRGCDHHDPFV